MTNQSDKKKTENLSVTVKQGVIDNVGKIQCCSSKQSVPKTYNNAGEILFGNKHIPTELTGKVHRYLMTIREIFPLLKAYLTIKVQELSTA